MDIVHWERNLQLFDTLDMQDLIFCPTHVRENAQTNLFVIHILVLIFSFLLIFSPELISIMNKEID